MFAGFRPLFAVLGRLKRRYRAARRGSEAVPLRGAEPRGSSRSRLQDPYWCQVAWLGRISALVAASATALVLGGSLQAVGPRFELTAGLPGRDVEGSQIVRIGVGGARTPMGRFRGNDPAWTRDGKRLAFVREGRLWISAPSGAGATALTPEWLIASDPDWSPDARQIVFECYDSRFKNPGPREISGICLVGGGRVLRLLVSNGVRTNGQGGYFVNSPRWSPVGDEITTQAGIPPARVLPTSARHEEPAGSR